MDELEKAEIIDKFLKKLGSDGMGSIPGILNGTERIDILVENKYRIIEQELINHELVNIIYEPGTNKTVSGFGWFRISPRGLELLMSKKSSLQLLNPKISSGLNKIEQTSQIKMKKSEKNIILELVSKGRTDKALEKLLSMELSAKDKTTVVQIKASFENLKEKVMGGLVNFEEETIERNRINDRLLRLLNNDDSAPAGEEPKHKERKWWKYVVYIGVVVGILGGIAEFSGWNLSKIFGDGSADNTFTVTVFVHGKKGKDDRILKNQGQVMLGLRTNEIPCSINEKGEATFKEIAREFSGKKVPIRIEHPQPYRATNPDSLYLLEPNAAIYVEVALEGTNRIFGTVMDFDTEQWLDSVRVSIENFDTYTDKFGWFELNIPEDKQRKFQRVSFFKKGYKIKELDSIPVHTQQSVDIPLSKQ